MDKKDYEEPRCPMDNSMWVEKKVTPIPVSRVIEKEDEYLSKRDYDSAERHLLYWVKEAENGNDERGKLLLFNELMGLHRKLGNKDKAIEYADKAVLLTESLEIGDTISGATAYLNAGTVYKAFDIPEKSLEFFSKCRDIYEKNLESVDIKKAGLYNNMALTLVDLKKYSEAKELYYSALKLVENVCKTDEAITLLNLVDCIVAEKGLENAFSVISDYISKAEAVLDSVPENERDAYFAFVCEKCSPVFDYYGHFFAAKKFSEISKSIYNKNK